MQSVTCIYLHGFLSSANSAKGQWIKQQINESAQDKIGATFDRIITLTYPLKSPSMSLNKIESVLRSELNSTLDNRQKSVVLMGSSMGGYYAQYLGQKYKIPYVMINPALNPVPIFKAHIGSHVNHSTGEIFNIDLEYIQQIKQYDVAVLDKKVAALLLVDEGDELIDIDYVIRRYKDESHLLMDGKKNKQALTTFKVIQYPGGDHAFQHLAEAWPSIVRFIKSL